MCIAKSKPRLLAISHWWLRLRSLLNRFTAFCCDISDGANRPAYCSGGMDTLAATLRTLCESKFCVSAKILLQRVTSSDGKLPSQ